jgi:hypothetical protein
MEINNLKKNIFELLVIGETDAHSANSGLRYFFTLDI